MQNPTEVTFHGIDASEAVEAAVQRWLARLEHVYDRIQSCAVTVSIPHKHHRQGRRFDITLRLDIPGNHVVATVTHPDVYVAIADAFRAARRQLLDHLDIQRGFVKTPSWQAEPPHPLAVSKP